MNAPDFKPGTIVCDASAPVNVAIEKELRDDVFIYHGGIAAIPFPLEIDFDIGLASPYTFYGCQLEGLLIGLHPELPCSWGRGNISLEKLGHYLDIFNQYQSLQAAFTLESIYYTEEQIDSYAKMWQDNRWKCVVSK